MDAVIGPETLVDRSRLRWTIRSWIPLGLMLASLAALSIDISMASAFDGKGPAAAIERQIRESLEICEAFGHGFGATLIVISVGVLDPLNRRYLPGLFASSLGSGMAANLLKYIVPRTRPRDFDLTTGSVWETFVRGSHTGWGMQSFPSAHTATAVGLAMALTALYPRGRWFFAIMAMLVGLQRVVSSAHFPSDVFAGAAVGCLVGTVCVNSMKLTELR